MSKMTLEDLMGQMDPKKQELQAKFTHSQIAVDMGYRLAKDMYIESKRSLNPEYVKGGDESKYLYTEPTDAEKLTFYVSTARLLKAEIEKDLNETLKVLEVTDGPKAPDTKLS